MTEHRQGLRESPLGIRVALTASNVSVVGPERFELSTNGIKRLLRQETASTCPVESGWSIELLRLPIQSCRHVCESLDDWMYDTCLGVHCGFRCRTWRRRTPPKGSKGPLSCRTDTIHS